MENSEYGRVCQRMIREMDQFASELVAGVETMPWDEVQARVETLARMRGLLRQVQEWL